MSNKPLSLILAILVAFQAGLLVAQTLPTASAQEAPAPEAVPFYDPPRLYCRTFRVPIDGAGSTFETNDRTTEIGKWIEKEEQSYELFTVDFEVGQKATGYAQGFVQVCLSPRRG